MLPDLQRDAQITGIHINKSVSILFSYFGQVA